MLKMRSDVTTFIARDGAEAPPPAPLAADTALFLDFDGTLVEIAARPQDVVVPAGLVQMLGGLRQALGGALAIVTGRPLEQIDECLAPLVFAAAGEHGAVRRTLDGRVERAVVPDFSALLSKMDDFASRHPGVLAEHKSFGAALHYRAAPEQQDACLALAQEWVRAQDGWTLLHGKAVVEVKLAGVDKGRALRALMQSPPFVGRRALFMGDDVTDEAAIAAAQELGGAGVKVGEGASAARHRLGGPNAVLDFLGENLARLTASK